MSLIQKGFRKIGFYIETVVARLRWNCLSVDGIFRKRKDTQIIISENGQMKLGKDILFQRNVSLTAVGGCFRLGTMCRLIETA